MESIFWGFYFCYYIINVILLVLVASFIHLLFVVFFPEIWLEFYDRSYINIFCLLVAWELIWFSGIAGRFFSGSFAVCVYLLCGAPASNLWLQSQPIDRWVATAQMYTRWIPAHHRPMSAVRKRCDSTYRFREFLDSCNCYFVRYLLVLRTTPCHASISQNQDGTLAKSACLFFKTGVWVLS